MTELRSEKEMMICPRWETCRRCDDERIPHKLSKCCEGRKHKESLARIAIVKQEAEKEEQDKKRESHNTEHGVQS